MASLMALPSEVGPLLQLHEIGEPGFVGQVEDLLRLIIVITDPFSTRAAADQLRLDLGEAVVGVLQEDQAHDRRRVLAGLTVRVRAKLIGRLPEAAGDVVDISSGGAGFGAHSVILTIQD